MQPWKIQANKLLQTKDVETFCLLHYMNSFNSPHVMCIFWCPSMIHLTQRQRDASVMDDMLCYVCARPQTQQFAPEKWCLGDNPFLLGPMFTGYDVRVEEGYFRCCTTTQHVVHHHPIGIKVERFLPTVSLDSAKR